MTDEPMHRIVTVRSEPERGKPTSTPDLAILEDWVYTGTVGERRVVYRLGTMSYEGHFVPFGTIPGCGLKELRDRIDDLLRTPPGVASYALEPGNG